MIKALILAELVLLSIAARQDLKTREIDVWIVLAMYLPAALAAYLSWTAPLYLMSPVLGAMLALAMRAMGAGYADSLALLAISLFPPPVPYFPTPAVVVMGTAFSIVGTMLWLYYLNSRRPCRMTPLQRLTHVCVSRDELLRGGVKYIVGDVHDLEKYRPPADVDEEYVVAKYGLPYLAHLAVGFAIYTALSFIL